MSSGKGCEAVMSVATLGAPPEDDTVEQWKGLWVSDIVPTFNHPDGILPSGPVGLNVERETYYALIVEAFGCPDDSGIYFTVQDDRDGPVDLGLGVAVGYLWGPTYDTMKFEEEYWGKFPMDVTVTIP
jgi:hypothetical protein